MNLNTARVQQLLKAFDFRLLFIEELGWDHHDARLDIILDSRTIRLQAFAQKRGMVAYLCPTTLGECLPDYAVRRKIEHQAAKTAHEHLIVFIDANQTTQVWQWVRREPGKPIACREHTFHKTQPGDAIIQKLQAIAFSLEEEETLTLTDVTRRAKAGFDVERVTKHFFDRFKKEHATFLKFVTGITDKTDHEWYASVMLNRLMFVYFIQRKGFLEADPDYLRNRLARMRSEYGQDRFYSFYRYFLLRLFHEGLGGKIRTSELEKLLGKIPYFDGGFFEKHPVEQRYSDIQIPDKAFERIFDYFDQYQWHLDERPLRADNEINPDVLGYIFEKYINQKQMGAYYTKEDITEYISKNTVIPYLFDAARSRCKVAFENPGGPTVWSQLSIDPDRYLYPAVKHGVIREGDSVLPEADLPDFVQIGMYDPKARMFDNRYNSQQAPDNDPIRLVTETWREYVYRRNRCLEIREKLQRGGVQDINDLITLNLDIRQFAQDVIENCEAPDLLRAFWHTIKGHIPEKSHEKYQSGIAILDPTCGSGAFLFAALNILESLYEACLDRMSAFVEDFDRSKEKHRPEKFSEFRKVLKQVKDHPNRRYFIFKNIILNNLFGVDIMEEAVEICKLRLFLKLAAQVNPDPNKDNFGIEPLPDIDFNIRTGNTLVGYATAEEVRKVFKEDSQGQAKLQFGEILNEFKRFEEQIELSDRAFKQFRRMQIDPNMDSKEFASAKQTLRKRLKTIDDELNHHLSGEYGVKTPSPSGRGTKGEGDAYDRWLKSHQPFHWFVEFYGIIKSGGFDVIIGNPPYVEFSKIRKDYTLPKGIYSTEHCGNLYAFVVERCGTLSKPTGRQGFILPTSSIATNRMSELQRYLLSSGLAHSTYGFRPSKLFEGATSANIHLSIVLLARSLGTAAYALHHIKWNAAYRPYLFQTLPLYTKIDHRVIQHFKKLPRLYSRTHLDILRKLINRSDIKQSFLNSSNVVYYRTTGGLHYRVFTVFPTKSRKENGIAFKNQTCRNIAFCAYTSNLWNLFYYTFSNCLDVARFEISRFPLGVEDVIPSLRTDLDSLSKRLNEDLRRNAHYEVRHYQNTGDVKCYTIEMRDSKPIIDEIDLVLAKHYFFTDEELDFIINYDIKYRKGRDGGNENGP